MATIGEITGLRKPKPWCDGKTQFNSKRAADVAIAALKRRADRERGQFVREPESLRAYECSTCRKWHFGHDRRQHGEEEEGRRRGEAHGGEGNAEEGNGIAWQ